MARFDLTLTGDKALQRTLADMTDKIERKVLVQAFRATARTVQQDAMARVPMRQVRVQSGLGKRRIRQLQRIAQKFARLRNNIVVKPLKRSRRRVGYTVWTATRQALGITSKYYYPAHLELGHGPPARGGRGRRGGARTPQHAYLRPAIRNPALLGRLTEAIRQGIERHAGDPPGSGGSLPSS
jgi:hypothetical protein